MSTAGKIKEEPKQEFQPVLCDICLDAQVPALKTCLKCEISMCAQHLQVHLTTPVLLQTHPLTKPTAPGGLTSGAVRCPEHGKLLEYYCLFDRICVCVSCSIEGQHRLHDMKTLPSAHKVLVEKLRVELKELDEREKQAMALKSWETEGTKALEVSTEYLVKRVTGLRDIGLAKVQSSVADRLGLIQTARQSIEAALSEEDAHLFLQKFAGVHEAVEKARVVNFIHGLEEKAAPTEVVSDILKNGHQAMEKVRKLQRDLLVMVDPDNLYWGESKPANVTFDPKTLGQQFLVSSDLKMLSCRPPIQCFSQTVHLQISTGNDLRWTIEFSEKYDWSVGISSEALHSLESELYGPLYGLEWTNNQFLTLQTNAYQNHAIHSASGIRYNCDTSYSIQREIINSLPESSTSLDSMEFKNKIEVHWDDSTQLMSFYIKCEYEVICLHRVEIGNCRFPFVNLVKRENDPANNMTVMDPYNRGFQPQSNLQNSKEYVDFVCALDDENLQTFYSRGKKSTP